MKNKYSKHIILPTEELADWFFENLYPYHIKFSIVTADGVYPKDKELREAIWNSFEDDPTVQIITFGELPEETITKIKNAKTTSVYNLNSLLRYELRKFYPFQNQEYGARLKLDFNPASFMKLLHHITDKDVRGERYSPRTDVTKVKYYSPYTYNSEKMGIEYDWKAILCQNLDPDFFLECTKEEAKAIGIMIKKS